MIDAPLTISLVTPSYNRGHYLEHTLRSVFDQAYPALEYVIIDGGSQDGTQAVIRRYADRLSYWVSEPDGGMYDALNKGFARTSGEIMAWINSDDLYTPWAFRVVSHLFATFPQIEWLTTTRPLTWDAQGSAVDCFCVSGYNRRAFMKGENLPGLGWHAVDFIQQESTFWRRSLWERAGGRIDSSLKLAGDFELWARFFQHAELFGVNTPLGGFRVHGDQKTAHAMADYLREAESALRSVGGRPGGRVESWLKSHTRHLPPLVLGIALRLGLVYRRPACRYDPRAGTWTITTAIA